MSLHLRVATLSLISSQEGRTALIYACRGGHLEIVTLLIKNGAQPNLASKVIAFLFSCFSSLFYSLDVSQNNATAFYNAAYYGHLEVLKFLMLNGADINLPQKVLLHSTINPNHS